MFERQQSRDGEYKTNTQQYMRYPLSRDVPNQHVSRMLENLKEYDPDYILSKRLEEKYEDYLLNNAVVKSAALLKKQEHVSMCLFADDDQR